ncbi:MAG: nuclear transport factor 2 family protein [Gammaproteobacteria bacterium]|nr:nuclear transport factor 2 family protein [Gammaproteobacteria bacterium]
MKPLKTFCIATLLASLPGLVTAASILDPESTAPTEVAEAIEAMILEWGRNWSTSNWAAIYDTWDPDEEAPYYLGEERERWLIGREGLESYFNPPKILRTIMGGVIMTPYRLRVRLVADDIAIVIWENKLAMDIKGRPPISDNFRANAVMRKTADGWRFIHYAEAPMAPLTYLEHLYRKSVPADYAEIVQPMDPDG